MSSVKKKTVSTSKRKTSDKIETVSHPIKKGNPTIASSSGTKEPPDKVKVKGVKSSQLKTSIKTSKEPAAVSNLTTTKSKQNLLKIKSTDSSKLNEKDNIKQRSISTRANNGPEKVTQYFPNKNLYMNRLRDLDPKLAENVIKRVSMEKKSTKVPAQRKLPEKRIIKTKSKDIESNLQSNSDQSSLSSSLLPERPLTATLRKGSIVNENIVGPDVISPATTSTVPLECKSSFEELTVKSKSNSEYDDDFESYESDFESCSSPEINSKKSISSISISDRSESPPNLNESNRMLSAGTDDEHKLDSGTYDLYKFKYKQNVPEHIKDLVKNEYRIIEDEKDNLNSFLDEGFVDLKSLQTINFADAKKRCEQKRKQQIRKKRGDDILSMIKLDSVNYTIFDLPSVPYEKFIAHYGNDNSLQVSIQTGEDDINEEIQTDELITESKWTQMPNQFSTFDSTKENFWHNYKNELAGVGGECVLGPDTKKKAFQINEKRLNAVIDLTLDLIEMENIHISNDIPKCESNLPFSATCIEFKTSDSLFDNTKVANVCIPDDKINTILSVHVKIEEIQDYKSILCIWNVNNFNYPEIILFSYGEISCVLFSPNGAEYIIAGQTDGTIAIWGLKEKSLFYDISNKVPCFITDIKSSHQSRIQSIQCNKEIVQYSLRANIDNNEIYSLDDQGCIIIWKFFSHSKTEKLINNLLLNKTAIINLSEFLADSYIEYTDLLIIKNCIYVSTNSEYIFQYSLDGSGKTLRKLNTGITSPIVCLEPCPFSLSFLLIGSSNGNLTIYSTITGKPLTVLRNTVTPLSNSSHHLIQWSNFKPFILYTKNLNYFHMWNLNKSDIYPEYSVCLKESISCFKLSPLVNGCQRSLCYMLIGTDDGKLYLHLLHEDYVERNIENLKKNIQTFINYVNRF